MKKYIITISIAVVAVITLGLGLGIGLSKSQKRMTFKELTEVLPKQPTPWYTSAENPFIPFTRYWKHIQHPDTPFTHSKTTEAEKHYQDLVDEGHQDVDNDNQLKYNY